MKEAFFQFRSGYSYEDALRLQGVLNSEGFHGLLAFECPETITLGRNAEEANDVLVSRDFLEERSVRLISTDRGGKATWHGPGQLVGFPVVNLRDVYADPRAVKRFSEELLMGLAHACAVLGVKSVETRADQPGIWTRKGKLGSLGITVKDGMVFHGFSLNVTQQVVGGFSLIQPCGIVGCPITSLEAEGVRVNSIKDVATAILPYLTVVNGNEFLKRSRMATWDDRYSSMVAKVNHQLVQDPQWITGTRTDS